MSRLQPARDLLRRPPERRLTGGNATRDLFALLKPQRYRSSQAWRWSDSSIESQDPIDTALVPPLKRSRDVRQNHVCAFPSIRIPPQKPFAHSQSAMPPRQRFLIQINANYTICIFIYKTCVEDFAGKCTSARQSRSAVVSLSFTSSRSRFIPPIRFLHQIKSRGDRRDSGVCGCEIDHELRIGSESEGQRRGAGA